jgi:phage terminase small subunit
MNRKLTRKRQRFVEEYLIDLNATQAAVRAGYSSKTANEQAVKLLANLSDEIGKSLAERSKRTEVTADRVVKELARIAFVDFRQVASWGPDGIRLLSSDDLSDDEAAIISEVSETRSESGGSLKAKRFDKIKALELLGRHLGMFVDKKEISGPDGAPLQVIIAYADDEGHV